MQSSQLATRFKLHIKKTIGEIPERVRKIKNAQEVWDYLSECKIPLNKRWGMLVSCIPYLFAEKPRVTTEIRMSDPGERDKVTLTITFEAPRGQGILIRHYKDVDGAEGDELDEEMD